MNGAFYIGATGLDAQQRALDVVANNIANVNTPGFKRSQIRFSEVLGGAPINGVDGSVGQGALTGVSADVSGRVFAQGDLKPTGSPLDVAIDGDGFLELMAPGGQPVLWRGGTLKVGADGYLAAANDMPLKAMIAVPTDASNLTIGRDGKVRATVGNATTELGQLNLVRAKDQSALTTAGEGGLYRAPDPADLMNVAPGEEGAGVLVQGSIESSNVQLTDEMVALLLMQRAYAANAQVIQAGDQLMSIANELKR
jgi:flagellar basal-body rod protein FlgG